jgi:hypothetical protein
MKITKRNRIWISSPQNQRPDGKIERINSTCRQARAVIYWKEA